MNTIKITLNDDDVVNRLLAAGRDYSPATAAIAVHLENRAHGVGFDQTVSGSPVSGSP